MSAREINMAIIGVIPLQGPGRTVDEIFRSAVHECPGVTREAVEALVDTLVACRAAWFYGPAGDRLFVRHH